MKILLLHVPVAKGVLKPDEDTESLSLGYIAAVLRRDGHEVEMLDARLMRLSMKETIQEVLSSDFQCIGITAMHIYKPQLIAVARAVKKRNKDTIVIAGGYLPTFSTEPLFKECPEIDIIVRGEGEATASELFGRIERGEDWSTTPGIAFMKDNELIMNPLPPLVDDLDSIPFPARDPLMQNRKPFFTLIGSSRGCYRRCSFCSISSFYGLSGSRIPRFRSAENFVDEIEHVISTTGNTNFLFIDDDFIGPIKVRDHAVSIAEEIIKRKLKITFYADGCADEIEEDIVKLLKEAGMFRLFLGIESGVQRQLDTYNKHITVEQNKRAIEIARKAGVEVSAGFITFDPYVTVEEVQENMQFLKDTGLVGNTTHAIRVQLYPGVPLVDQVRADGLLREKGTEMDYVFKNPGVDLVWKMNNMMSKLINAKKKFGLRRRLDESELEAQPPVP